MQSEQIKRLYKQANTLLFLVLLLRSVNSSAQEYRRWQMNPDGSISWQIHNNIPHKDHIEMSGKKISCVLRYGVAADGSFQATRSLVWPMLRTIPNNTHASLTRRFAQDGFELVLVNYKPIEQPPVVDVPQEQAKRLAFIRDIQQNLVLSTPDTVLNQEFAFAKVRASESIFETKGGPMHGPGGEAYYAAIWAN